MLALLAQLTTDQVPVNGDRGWVAAACAEHGLGTFDTQLALAATAHDWLLAEVLARLANGAMAGLSLIDFVPPDTVLALWHALPAAKRRYLRSVFGTVAGPAGKQAEQDRLAVLDRLVASAEEEVHAADMLLSMLVATNQRIDHALAGLDVDEADLPVEAVQQARGLTQAMLAAVAAGEDPAAWLEFPHHRPNISTAVAAIEKSSALDGVGIPGRILPEIVLQDP
jgi:hypothetical protein